ncbi:MAG: exonuclease SbcCD subunit D [Pirellulaceae bacterium]
MRILHTADWHLGRMLGGMDLLELQEYALEQLIAMARDQRPDAIVIAGDVYDRSVPPEHAIGLLDETLMRLREVAPVLAIAGNHDSGERLQFGAGLLRQAGVFVAGTSYDGAMRVDLEDRFGKVAFHLMPYSLPSDVRAALDLPDLRTHHEAIAARVENCDMSGTDRHVLVAHLFAAGGQATEDSERDISVGGSSAVESHLFDRFCYTALGHLHRPHRIGTDRIQYSGSLCRYSFAEQSHRKCCVMLELDGEGKVTFERLELPQKLGMRTLHGAAEDLLLLANQDLRRNQDLIRIELTDLTVPFGARERLKDLYPFLLELDLKRTVQPTDWTGDGEVTEQKKQEPPAQKVEQFLRERFKDRDLSEHLRLAAEWMEKAQQQEGGPR